MDNVKEKAVREKAVKGIIENMTKINDYDMAQIIDKAFIAGMPAVQLVNRYDEIRKYVDQNKLTVIPEERLPRFVKYGLELPRKGWWAGIPSPHLHLDGNVHEMTNTQWRQFHEVFMRNTVADIGAAIQNVKEVPFVALQQLTNAASQIGR